MKIPVEWLREYVDVPGDGPELQAFADRLTMAGLEVEEIFDSPAGLAFYTKITPNRGDWASVYGTAREAAAAGRVPLKPLAAPAWGDAGQTWDYARVRVEDAAGCPRYGARVIRNVRIGPSPQWMQNRLAAAGMQIGRASCRERV